jgi:hypothetical protein
MQKRTISYHRSRPHDAMRLGQRQQVVVGGAPKAADVSLVKSTAVVGRQSGEHWRVT